MLNNAAPMLTWWHDCSLCPAAGRTDIQTGQQALSGKLDILLQRQQAAIDAMNQANSQLATIQQMAQSQADALAALDAATNDRLNAISVATQQGVINLYQVGLCLQLPSLL